MSDETTKATGGLAGNQGGQAASPGAGGAKPPLDVFEGGAGASHGLIQAGPAGGEGNVGGSATPGQVSRPSEEEPRPPTLSPTGKGCLPLLLALIAVVAGLHLFA